MRRARLTRSTVAAALGTLGVVGVLSVATATVSPASATPGTAALTPAGGLVVSPITKPTIPGPCWPRDGFDLNVHANDWTASAGSGMACEWQVVQPSVIRH